MRIGVTVDALDGQRTGIGRYTWELCRGLQVHAAINDLAFSSQGLASRNLRTFLPKPHRQGLQRFRHFRRWAYDRYLRHRLIHGTNYFLPPHVERGVITAHDLSVFLYPESHPAERLRSFETNFQATLARASHVITDSHFIKNQMTEIMGIPAQDVSVVNLGVGAEFRPLSHGVTRPVIRQILGDDVGSYILALSTFEPRKRLETAILAHAHLCDTGRTRLPLVLAGASGWLADGLGDLIAREKQKGNLKVLGYVHEEFLPSLYAGAELFVYLSIYEGFGLPPLEAMRCGVPTLVADRSSLPEVTRGAAMLVDPDDVDQASEHMDRALHDTMWRAAAIKAGLEVARSYTWSRCVDQTVRVYRNQSQ